MKDNKITRKIMRLEILEGLIKSIDDKIESFEYYLKNEQQRMNDKLQEEEPSEYDIRWIQDEIEKNTINLDEAKKLRADLEKMV